MKWSMTKAAREWGLDDETLKRRLVEAGHEIVRGAEFTTKEISDAVNGGTLEKEKIRLTRAEAELKEKELQLQRGDLITSEAAKGIIADALGPIRSALVSWPSSLSARCNPSDPELARDVLAQAVKQLLQEASK